MQIIEYTLSGESTDVKRAMIPHIIKGMVGSPDIDCKSGQILNNILTSETGDNGINGATPVEVINEDFFLDAQAIENWQDDAYISSHAGSLYSSDLTETLLALVYDLKPLFDDAEVHPDIAFSITFTLGACVAVEVLGLDIGGCASFGYGVAFDGHDNIKTFVSGGITAEVGISVDPCQLQSLGLVNCDMNIPFGYDYTIAYDFHGNIGYIQGSSIGSEASGGLTFNTSPLDMFAESLGNFDIPSGVDVHIGYNGPIPFIDCQSWGFSIDSFGSGILEFGANFGMFFILIYPMSQMYV